MILVDSSGWIEYLAARPKAQLFAPYIEGSEPLLSSVIQVYEIYKVVRRDVNEERAIEVGETDVCRASRKRIGTARL